MTKKYLRVLLPAMIVAIGILMALTASSSAAITNQGGGTLTVTPPVLHAETSQPGSTDWITLVGVIIVLIVVIPVLLRRSTWTK